MGYLSDVAFAFAVETKEIRDEIMAVYAMDPDVQKYGSVKHFKLFSGDGYAGAYFHFSSVKWYDFYEGVKTLNKISEVVEMFNEERGIAFADQFCRIGENNDDFEWCGNEDGGDGSLREVLWDCVQLVRTVDLNFPEEKE